MKGCPFMSITVESVFGKELELIENSELQCVVRKYLGVVPQYFYEIPASSSGKYHPTYALGIGGLVRHTKAAVLIAYQLLQLEQYSDLPADEIIAALLIHDTFKWGYNSTHTEFMHPIYAATEFGNFAYSEGLDEETTELIKAMVVTHMGQWNEGDDCQLPKPATKSQCFVHMCDYLASRRCITVEVE